MLPTTDKSKKRKSLSSSDPTSKRLKHAGSAPVATGKKASPATSLTSSRPRVAKSGRKKAAEYFDDPGSSDDEFKMSRALPVSKNDPVADEENADSEQANSKSKAKQLKKKADKKSKPAVQISTEPKSEPEATPVATPAKENNGKLKSALAKKAIAGSPVVSSPGKAKPSVKFEEPSSSKAKGKAIVTKSTPSKQASASAPKQATATLSKVNKADSKKKKQAKPVVEVAPESESEDDDIEQPAETTSKSNTNVVEEEDIFAGFSDSDEGSDVEESENAIALADIPKAPVPKQDGSKKSKGGNGGKAASSETPGTIYVSSIPHGFYEPQMRAYFSQFGEINRLRLSRNRKTGHSKHFAFIEFASEDVAEIVAKTMNNYLLFNHRLRVQVKPADTIHKDLWKGAGRRFRVVPRAAMAKRALETPATREQWDKRVKAEKSRRQKKIALAKSLGYVYTAPTLRATSDVKPKALSA